MFQVAIYVEALRSRPTLVFWLATLAQAAVWFLVPVLFYDAPPSGLPQVLALGHGFPLDGRFGPPLAYWIAEIAFRLAGLAGVYALSQICLIAAYWCVFALGRAIVGEAHAAMAVLLMAGISVLRCRRRILVRRCWQWPFGRQRCCFIGAPFLKSDRVIGMPSAPPPRFCFSPVTRRSFCSAR